MKNLARIFLLIIIGFSPPSAFGQEQISPLIVDGPRISKTAFVNWDKIELTYTLRYMDGYEPVYDNMKAENMNFSPLEIDPEYADKPLDRRNERKYRSENYVDIIYHLRHVGEKKGDIVIAQQMFSYIKLEQGKEKSELEPASFKTQEFLLKYNSVLTKNADDIMDKIELGSFSSQAFMWHVSGISGFVVLSSLVLFVVFRRPTLNLASVSASRKKDQKNEKVKSFNCLELLSGAGQRLSEMNSSYPDFDDQVAKLHSACREVFRVYVPGVTDAFTSSQIRDVVKGIDHPWLRQTLLDFYDSVYICTEDYLYQVDSRSVDPSSRFVVFMPTRGVLAKAYAVTLRPSNIVRQKRLWFFKQKINRLKGLLRWKK